MVGLAFGDRGSGEEWYSVKREPTGFTHRLILGCERKVSRIIPGFAMWTSRGIEMFLIGMGKSVEGTDLEEDWLQGFGQI